MAKIPTQLTFTVKVNTGLIPTMTLPAPGPATSWVVTGVHSRQVNAGGGTSGLNLQVSDSIAGVHFSWETITVAAAGAVDIDDVDPGDLRIICQPGASVTVAWSGPVPAGGNSTGAISATFELAG